jgi:CheY-like chemotaxis protein/anti-sigma regulatory factor (Ser/Thr protein kinase)
MAQSPEYYGYPLPGPYVRDLSIVHRNACHLQSLVNDVLDLSRIEATEMSLTLEIVSPADLVTEAVGTARSLVESQGLDLHVEIEPDLPSLRADATRIRQVLFNLLNNAARFTERGSVTVTVHRQADEVVFLVQDTGVGIAPEDIPKVFQEFKQLDGSTRRRHGGIGLGLAISKGFVELHGGRIWCTSQPGEGSTFSFALPLRRPDVSDVNIGRFTQSRRAAATGKDEQCIVLAVTGSLSAAGLLTRYLQGARTVVVSNLEQAQAMAQELLPQVLVIDQASVPVPEGPVEELVHRWNIPSIPLVVCPLPGEEPMRQQLNTAGYLTKPVRAVALWDVLRQFGERADRVLVVDDDRDFVRLLGRLLDNPVRRYAVRSAYSGQEALETLRRWEPDLVLLDLGLPDLSGQQVIRHMQDDARWRDIPVVIVTGQDGPETVSPMRGHMTVSKAGGLVPGETIHWIQGVIDTATHKTPSAA